MEESSIYPIFQCLLMQLSSWNRGEEPALYDQAALQKPPASVPWAISHLQTTISELLASELLPGVNQL